MKTVSESQIPTTELAELTVFNEAGHPVQMGTLWRTQPAILVFLRHFACIACRAHAKEVWTARHEYEQSGSKIVFIGCGSAESIRRFKTDMGMSDAPVFSDPDLNVFAAAGFKRGFLISLGPQAVFNFIRLKVSGHQQVQHQKSDGDRLQLGGVLLVMPDGHIRYKFTSAALGHFPLASDLKYVAGSVNQPFALTSVSVNEVPDFSQR